MWDWRPTLPPCRAVREPGGRARGCRQSGVRQVQKVLGCPILHRFWMGNEGRARVSQEAPERQRADAGTLPASACPGCKGSGLRVGSGENRPRKSLQRVPRRNVPGEGDLENGRRVGCSRHPGQRLKKVGAFEGSSWSGKGGRECSSLRGWSWGKALLHRPKITEGDNLGDQLQAYKVRSGVLSPECAVGPGVAGV